MAVDQNEPCPAPGCPRDKDLCREYHSFVGEYAWRKAAVDQPEGPCGITLIAQERRRQVEQEGWDSTHDDEAEGFELSRAGACYAQSAVMGENAGAPREWPWSYQWWKPGKPIRMLVKAGALIAAEIDRRLRAGEKL